jgi:diaminopimelate decarboxylase
MGAGADVVSEGELLRVLAAGVPAERVVFSGVGKTETELRRALTLQVGQINVESRPELEKLSAVATAMGVTARVALRINPDVDARTHAKITTGKKENKFGIDLVDAPEAYAFARTLPGIDACSVAMHIGSQLVDIEPYRTAYGHAATLVRALRAEGHTITGLDLGGGIGIPYHAGQVAPSLTDYAAIIAETVGDLGCHLTIEPGRSLVGQAGLLLTQVIYMKQGAARRFAIVDAAMNDLIRPSLYDAYHPIATVLQPDGDAAPVVVDVVGPICESGDLLATQRALPPLEDGDLIALGAAGAYGAVMASTYNTRPLVAEVLVRGDSFAVVRARRDVADLIAWDSLPPWLEG